MANTELQADSACANPDEQIYELATKVQGLCSQIKSLAGAVAQDAFDTDNGDSFNFADLIRRIADEASGEGEKIEKLAATLKREA